MGGGTYYRDTHDYKHLSLKVRFRPIPFLISYGFQDICESFSMARRLVILSTHPTLNESVLSRMNNRASTDLYNHNQINSTHSFRRSTRDRVAETGP